MNKLWFYVTTNWQTVVLGSLAVLLISGLLFFKIGTLTGGVSPSEIAIQNQNPSFRSIARSPVNAPFYVLRNTGQKLRTNTVISSRKLSALVALTAIVAFYILLRFWYSLRVATLGTMLFASSSWLLRTGRFGTPDDLQSLIIIPILFSTWLLKTKRRQLVLAILTIVAGVMVYIPGVVWLILAAVIWRRQALFLEIRTMSRWFTAFCYGLFLIIISPLAAGIVRTPKILLSITGLPDTINLAEFFNNLWHLPLNIFVRSDLSPQLAIAHLPLLDIFSTAMAALGIYSSIKFIKLDRNKLSIGALVACAILVSLGGSVTLALIMPIVYLLITAGVAFMLEDWFRVFPRNPLAANIGSTLMTIAVLLTMFYHINNYFIAWPNTSATKSEFSKRL